MVDYFNLDPRPYAELNEEERKAKFGHNKGKSLPHSEETKRKISEAAKKRWKERLSSSIESNNAN